MPAPLEEKSTVEEIRKRFDNDVERFSDFDTGQQATIDAPLAMELIARAAIACTPNAKTVIDINKEDSPRPVTYQLELLRKVGFIDVDILHKNSCFAAFGARKGGRKW